MRVVRQLRGVSRRPHSRSHFAARLSPPHRPSACASLPERCHHDSSLPSPPYARLLVRGGPG
eukprot:scaffold253271_cov31-Tisochrysis_lutea.AAC.2